MDITSEDSLSLVKQILNIIIINLKSPFVKKLLVINKIDLEEKRKVSNYELSDYINEFNSEFEDIEISIKTKQNLKQLWEKVNECVNKSLVKIPINLLSERIEEITDADNIIRTEGSINIILIGDSGVGKTNVFSRYFQNKFEQNFISTIGMDRQTKFIKYQNKIYKFNISDTAGQERFRSLPIKYYQNADGALLLFDISSRESFDNISLWMNELNKNYRKTTKQTIYLIGNKIDLSNRQVTTQEGKELAEKYGLQYYEMSCKININIYEIISRLIIDCFNNLTEGEEKTFKLKDKDKNRKKGCC